MKVRGLVPILLLAASLASVNCSAYKVTHVDGARYNERGEYFGNADFVVKHEDFRDVTGFFDEAKKIAKEHGYGSPELRKHLAKHKELLFR
jgi:hypothetical protein